VRSSLQYKQVICLNCRKYQSRQLHGSERARGNEVWRPSIGTLTSAQLMDTIRLVGDCSRQADEPARTRAEEGDNQPIDAGLSSWRR
jgi:hypothetical protein